MNRPLKSPERDIINKYDICYNNYNNYYICVSIYTLSVIISAFLYIHYR